ncbi:MAG: tRNA (N(6)-L-threonylcarbamoyladenosine(37)-C(2))-methylthiotransferase MtaB [Candidatus Puniceispirillum sp.]|nr:tRNA (N(6)-L-threonylcarbamoyladenosine(37)-C(2))-methylthiotransferase MtaB [Candidatus Pelagibacter sp.]MBA4282867.1 tRNA (N(6)-L-threonylcarbamoyladenosine(37)-C(2))-methylthiotransferase MtaB [Candidatus Puniceispirillum sp.]
MSVQQIEKEDDFSKKNNIDIITFGCRLNSYESEVIKNLSSDAGLDNITIINTCAVTSEAERQAKQTIRKIRKNNPSTKIIVTGCGAQINPDIYAAMDEVNHVIGNDEKMKPETYHRLSATTERVLVNDIMSVTETANHLISGFENKSRAFIQVQNGCNHRCTFCIIPYGRGNSRSVPIGEIVNQIKLLVKNGVKEIVFTGVDITSYGEDLPGKPKFGEMVQRILNLVPELPRLRISSVDPSEIDETFWHVFATDHRIMPHLHLSLQSGDNVILRRMKRRHLRDDVYQFCDKARTLRPDVVFGADIIVGFPTESDEMFKNTCNLVEECNITFLHVFPYSSRPGTPASKITPLPKAIVKKRAADLRSIGQSLEENLLKKLVNQKSTMLVEKITDEHIMGKNDYFIPMRVTLKPTSTLPVENSILLITATDFQNGILNADDYTIIEN